MIVYAITSLIFTFINVIFGLFQLPGLPDEAAAYMEQFLDVIGNASGFFNLVFPINVLPFIGLCVSITVAHHIYALAMWVLRKIPLLGLD